MVIAGVANSSAEERIYDIYGDRVFDEKYMAVCPI
jgi:hypothetical protein